MSKAWYKSKTKLGAVIAGAGTVLVATGSYIAGDISATVAIEMALIGVGSILFGLGIRDAITDLE